MVIRGMVYDIAIPTLQISNFEESVKSPRAADFEHQNPMIFGAQSWPIPLLRGQRQIVPWGDLFVIGQEEETVVVRTLLLLRNSAATRICWPIVETLTYKRRGFSPRVGNKQNSAASSWNWEISESPTSWEYSKTRLPVVELHEHCWKLSVVPLHFLVNRNFQNRLWYIIPDILDRFASV